MYAGGSLENWPPEMRSLQEFHPQEQDSYAVGLIVHKLFFKKQRPLRTNPIRSVISFFRRGRAPEGAVRKMRYIMQGLLHERPEYRMPVWEALEQVESVACMYGW